MADARRRVPGRLAGRELVQAVQHVAKLVELEPVPGATGQLESRMTPVVAARFAPTSSCARSRKAACPGPRRKIGIQAELSIR